MTQTNKLAKQFHFWSLAGFALPTMVMMLVTGLYSVVDTIFVSRLISTDALSSVNIVYPVLNVVMGAGIMLATGGSAIVARKLGQGKEEEARRNFSFLILMGIALGIVFAAVGLPLLEPIVRALGSSEKLFADGCAYLRASLWFSPCWILSMIFSTFFVTAGRPNLGMGLSVAAGITNGVLDYVFIAYAGLGVAGAAIASGIGQLVIVVAGLVVFARKKGSLYFGKPKGSLRFVGGSCFNGSSEMVSNLSMGITTFLFNIQMMKLVGENGVAAITVVMSVQFILSSLLMGYAMGVAPVVSYNYGKGDSEMLRRVVKYSLVFVSCASVLIACSAPFLSPFIIRIFTDNAAVTELARQGILPYSFSFLLCGINIFASALYTAFSNGKISALLSFLRTCVLLSAGILLLPLAWGVTGVWLAVPAAELVALVISALFLKHSRKLYRY